MFCSNCGAQLGDQNKFCKVCGTPVAAPANAQPAPVAAPAAAPAPAPQIVVQPVVQQPAVQQPVPQPAPVVYQQPVQAAPQTAVPQQAAPTVANVKAGPRRACFVMGLITCIMLIVINVPTLAIACVAFVAGPIAMMFGASNYEDIFLFGLIALIIGAVLIAAAVIAIVFNGLSTKISAKRPESKCYKFRMAAAVIALIDSLVTVAPVVCLNNMVSDAEAFYGFAAVVFILAVIFFILAIITNSKAKKLAKA